MESNYSKLYAGSFIVVQLITQNLEKQGITPIVKDETESARLAGFGTPTYGFQELYVNLSEKSKAEAIVASTLAEF
ncbi:DUF2007 domain-containing protein [Flavobacteriaceae bacterium]|jgi:hypothetical protein|nr:DUF2007 domain-containing protein [Flavobacteriaceae bacterium]MDA7724183.1 DUF2007 domain-containing protein [Flavobacteriaceae bacterium]MDA7728132.1 DUF2007 domain-containing protein [Flavobacteriaceae bacterium]MDA7848966.1 DUF2007 domain-containing protein [Flavobacteriaceae bacterium]MDB4178585.1 DUF2007 domain-containing protein [Flavobacteriaceae bacterium]|tara:strand:+ start:8762 stop:8989 length:228 start_codon:yes stop_codon:yes gene_type:complete